MIPKSNAMLHVFDNNLSTDCSHTSRRDFLKVGLGSFAGLAGLQSTLAAAPLSIFKNKSVVLLFLCGGASHIETFDPKMTAPAGNRSVTGAISTAVPGIEFGSTYEGLAQRADRLAVVRSYAPHGISDHATAIKHTLTSGSEDSSSIGSRFARLRGANHPQTGMPTYCTLIENNETDSQYMEDRERMQVGSQPGELGQAYAGFSPFAQGPLRENMQLNMPLNRLRQRRKLLSSLDSMRRELDQTGGMEAMDSFHQQAVDVILGGGVQEALDLSQEDPRVIAQYDTSGFEVGWTKKRSSTLGERLLLARRLCQAGCGFVTVGSAGWDNHANGKHPNVFDGMNLLGRPLDKAVSAFLDDVRRVGMEDDILLVITSEFGRTPKIGNNCGRDHWPGINSLVFAGGGLNMGQVIGESTSKAEEPKTDPIGFDGLLGTIWHTLFDLSELRLVQSLPRDLRANIEQAKPISQLV